MTAGTGVRHSEFNHAEGQITHFLQIWLLPAARDLPPAYEQMKVDEAGTRGQLHLVGAPGGGAGVLNLQADARLYQGRFDGAERAEMALSPQRLSYVHVVRGRLSVNGEWLEAGDAAKLQGEAKLTLSDGQGADVLVFDLAP
jgi:redox-sensitive bicupin YhaK (pirin superfamily)